MISAEHPEPILTIKDGDLVASLEQIGGHVLAHVAQTNEADLQRAL